MKVLVGLALVGLAVAGCPPDAGAREVEVRIKLTLIRSKCTARFIDSRKNVKYSSQDSLLFNFANHCPAQQVFVCVDTKKTTYPAPWDEKTCKGSPDSATVGAQFGILPGTDSTPAAATVQCAVQWPESQGNFTAEMFGLQVFNARRGKVKCPQKAKNPRSELALEVDP